MHRALSPDRMLIAESQALNRTRANVNKLAVKIAAQKLGVKPAKIAKRARAQTRGGKFGAVGPGEEATRTRLETSIIGRGRPFNVGRWRAKVVRAGASQSLSGRNRRGTGVVLGVTHSAYGREQFARSAWMLNNGAVVKRRGQSFTGVFGPGVAQQLEAPDVVRRLERLTQRQFARHFASAVRHQYGRRR